jgi:predicted PurR-regulated permease PerM
VEIRPSARVTLRVVAIVFAVLIALRFLWIAHTIFIVAFLGIIFGIGLTPGVDWLEKHRVKRGLGAALIVLLLIGILVGAGAMVGPSLGKQTGEIVKEAPKTMKTLQQRVPILPRITAMLGKEVRNIGKLLFPAISSLLGAIGGLVLIIFIGMYIAVEPGLYRAGILHLIPHDARPRAHEVLDTLRNTLRGWLFARLLAMIIIGTLTGVALALMKVKGAAALGLLAGIFELIPFFGPIVSAIPAVGLALVDSPQKALGVGVLYLLMQQLEGNVISPLILEKRLAIPPVLTVLAVSAMGIVFGVLGMLVAEPLLAAGLVLTKMLYVEQVVGDDVKIGAKE